MSERITELGEEADRLFSCGDTARAAFEAGIKLGAVFHQFTGTPVSADGAAALEEAMEKSMKCQPYVSEASVRIDREMLGKALEGKEYTTLEGKMLDIEVIIKYKTVTVHATLRYNKELDYPLMYIENVNI